MDDDDYYYPDGLIAKVRSIITHKKDCLVSLNLPCFNLTTLEQFRVKAKENQYPEATFFFKKDFKVLGYEVAIFFPLRCFKFKILDL